MEKRERAIELGKQISETRERLAALEHELDTLLGTATATANTTILSAKGVQQTQWRTGTSPIHTGSIASRIVGLLDGNPRPWTTQEIFDALRSAGADAEQGSVLATLSRLASENQIERTDRGVYRKKG